VGIEWAITQSKELIAAQVPVIHFYTMGRSDNIYQIAKACF
jgi:methylenetetrahydrofolate reductase (NADPH)